jgi:hypothetical protein
MLVALIAGAGGILLGLAARLGRFCTLGAIEDYLYGDNDTRLRMWGVAIGVSIFGSFLASQLGYFGFLAMVCWESKELEYVHRFSLLGLGLLYLTR